MLFIVISGFHLDQPGVNATGNNEIHLSIFFRVEIEQIIAVCFELLRHNVFQDASQIHVQMATEQVELHIFHAGGAEQSNIVHEELKKAVFFVQLQRRLGLGNIVAGQRHPRVTEPLEAVLIPGKPGGGRKRVHHKAPVLVIQLRRNRVEDRLDLDLFISVRIPGDILPVQLQQRCLHRNDLSNIVGIHICLNHIRHTAHHDVAVKQLCHGFVHRRQNGRFGIHTCFQVLNGRILNTVCPQEFLEVHGIHAVDFFKAYGKGFDGFVLRSQQGAGFNIVKPSVLYKELDGRPNIGALLDFIKENQCFPGLHRLTGIGSQICNNGVDIQVARKNAGSIRVGNKIDLYKVFVVFFSEFPNQCCFSNLSCAKNTKRFVIAILFPIQELLICLPLQHTNHLNPVRVLLL